MRWFSRLFALLALYCVADAQTLGPPNGSSSLIPITSNQTLYVATTGNDNNACTISAKCATITHVMSILKTYDFQYTYTATVNVADGTYTGTVTLPSLYHYPVIFGQGGVPVGNFPALTGDTATPTNAVITSTSGDAINTEQGATWNISGFQLKSTSGTNSDLNFSYNSYAIINHLDFAGSGILVNVAVNSIVNAISATLTSSSSSFSVAINSVITSWFVNDSATWTINNSPTVSKAFANIGDRGMLGAGSFVNAGTVTGPKFILFNYGLIEYTGSQASFPGSTAGTFDFMSIFEGDNTVNFGAANFNISNSGDWTFNPVENLWIVTSSTVNSGFVVQNTSSGGHELNFYTVGSGGVTGLTVGQSALLDVTTGALPYWIDTSGNTNFSGSIGMAAPTIETFTATTVDSRLSRLGAASFALGNGTVGDFSGTLKLAHLTATALANSATTSAVCYNTSTGVLTYDGTIGTCTTSDERLKNMGARIPNALERLLQINGVGYTWKDPSYGTGPQIGVGAQTVERVFPELVQTGSDGYKSVDYQRLTAPIIEALRELKADNDNLQAQIVELKRRRRIH